MLIDRPVREQPQHLRALNHGNQIRLERAALKRELRDIGAQQALRLAADLILEIPVELESCAIGDFLTWVPRIGPTWVGRYLRSEWIGEHRTLAQLSQRQAFVIAGELRQRAGGLA